MEFTSALQTFFNGARVKSSAIDSNLTCLRIAMLENQKIRPAQVIGPLGEPLTLDRCRRPSTTRWVVRRKAEVVAAVAGGLLTRRRGVPALHAQP